MGLNNELRKKTGLDVKLIDNSTILVNKPFKCVTRAKECAISLINEAAKLGIKISKVEAVLSNGKMTMPFVYNAASHPHNIEDYQKQGGKREN
jgi:hypothetical protein